MLRRELKKAGCRVTALDAAIVEKHGGSTGRRPSQADILIELAKPADLFDASDGTAFADIEVNGHRETWPIPSKGFRRWLNGRFYEETGGAPNSQALQLAQNVFEAKAHYGGQKHVVHVRVGEADGRLYLDLCDDAWRAVEIDAQGWRVIDNPPVRFRRSASMKALPRPVEGGSINELRRLLNVRSDNHFVLVVSCALACLNTRGPYPLLVVSGEQGSAKSTFSAMVRALVDPNVAPLRALPREDRDLFIAATNSHVLAFDNVSGLPLWTSDALCRLSTGGSFATRELYTDGDEMLFEASRPVILNGITDIVTRPDLVDRAIPITLDPIPDERRRSERELWAAFDAEHPRILGVLLDAVVRGLAMLPHTALEMLPRMADFALWATACETALWPAGTFMSAYCRNRDEAVDDAVDADPISSAVRGLMLRQPEWAGTATDLLAALSNEAGNPIASTKGWPESAKALSNRLRRAATFLRKVGIEIASGREGHARTRIIRIARVTSTPTAADNGAAEPSASSASSAFPSEAHTADSFALVTTRTDDAHADVQQVGRMGSSAPTR